VKLPTPLRRAAVLVAVEGAGIALVGVVYAVLGLLGHPEDRLATVLAGVLGLGVGLALLLAGRGLAAGRGWSLAPGVLAQLFLLVVGAGLLQGHVYAVGVLLLLLAVGTLSQLGSRASRDVFSGQG